MSLLVRIFFVVAMALLPVVLVEVVEGIEHRAETEHGLKGGATRLASVIGMEEDRVFEVTRRYLGIVAQLEPIRTQAPDCGAALTRAAAPYPALAHLALVTRSGAFVCGSPGAQEFVSGVGERPLFHRALETGTFAVGGFVPGAETGLLQLAMPVTDGGVLIAGFDVAQFTAMLPEALLPSGAGLVMADAEGTVLASLPRDFRAPGSRIDDSERALLHGAAIGAVDETGPAGRRIYGYVPIEAQSAPGVFVAVSLDPVNAFARIEADGRWQIGALNGALALGIFMAWMCGRKFITRPAEHLLAAAERWREGDWSARTAFNDPDSEFGRLSAAFDAMADAVGDRESRLRKALIENAAANAAKDDFLSAINHELRTPLNPIVGFAELMLEEIHGPLAPAYRDYAHDIKACGEHLVEVVDGILDLSQAATGHLALVESEADPTELVAGALRAIEAATRDSGLAFEIKTASDLPALRCDVLKVKQMLAQLLGNAIKFTPAGGTIAVEIACRGGELAMSVRDTGPGISGEHLPHVAEPLFRAHDTYICGGEGTGIGLALVKAMAELHGGRLEIASTLGEGTTATIVFPASRSVPVAPATEAA